MGLRLFHIATGFEQARLDVRYSAARLGASPLHGNLRKPLDGLLAEWSVIDRDRSGADDALVDANAQVAAVDAELDEQVAALGSRLRYELSNGISGEHHPTFKKYFPDPVSHVTRLGLESELARVQRFGGVAAEVGASAEVRAILKAIAAIEPRGRAALAERATSEQRIARISVRMQGWKDAANGARRTVAHQLDAHATRQHLPRSYSSAFFPPPARRPRTGSTAPDPVTP